MTGAIMRSRFLRGQALPSQYLPTTPLEKPALRLADPALTPGTKFHLRIKYLDGSCEVEIFDGLEQAAARVDALIWEDEQDQIDEMAVTAGPDGATFYFWECCNGYEYPECS
jgi:hypothetical protein